MNSQQEDLLRKYVSMALPYGVKILYEGWDSDRDDDFSVIETIIGADNRFIYTKWGKTGDEDKHCFSVDNWKLYLYPLSSINEKDGLSISEYVGCHVSVRGGEIYFPCDLDNTLANWEKVFNWLVKHHFDFLSLIPKGLAIGVTEDNNPYKEE